MNDLFGNAVDVVALTVKNYAVELVKVYEFDEIKLIVAVLSVFAADLTERIDIYQINIELLCCIVESSWHTLSVET